MNFTYCSIRSCPLNKNGKCNDEGNDPRCKRLDKPSNTVRNLITADSLIKNYDHCQKICNYCKHKYNRSETFCMTKKKCWKTNNGISYYIPKTVKRDIMVKKHDDLINDCHNFFSGRYNWVEGAIE